MEVEKEGRLRNVTDLGQLRTLELNVMWDSGLCPGLEKGHEWNNRLN